MTDFKREEQLAERIARRVDLEGGKTFYVGGYVRDMILRVENKDIDIEVHGIEPEKLKTILSEFGKLDERKVGEHFGVLNLHGYNLDISMPRAEKPTSENGGHKDFIIDVDPFIGEKKAAQRRDFTINALMFDLITGEVLDFFDGIRDLESGIIRHVDNDSFGDDPLRVLRAAQFAARFGFTIAEETMEICRHMDLTKISHERVAMEMTKALQKSERPSVFFDVLKDMGQLHDWFPEVEALIGTPQNKKHHAEGDAYNHTMLVLDEAAKCKDDVFEPNYFMVAALCHDFGKPLVTEWSEEKQKWTSIGHDKAGEQPARDFVRRIYNDKHMEEYVANMVTMHMKPLLLMKEKASTKSYMHMIDKMLIPEDAVILSRCDNRGKRSEIADAFDEQRFVDMCDEYARRIAAPHVTGKDLKELGFQEGPLFKEILEYSHKLQLAGLDKIHTTKQIIGMYGKILKEGK